MELGPWKDSDSRVEFSFEIPNTPTEGTARIYL